MTPKEKAEELVEKYDEMLTYLESKTKAKQCSLLALDEIINTLTDVMWINDEHTDFARKTKYWYEVKSEIENL